MTLEFKVLHAGDERALAHVAPDVFDDPVQPQWAAEFLADPRHHLAVAIDDDVVVGFASGVHYVHPDKPPELWINEVGVAPTHRQRGIARSLLETLFEAARELGCRQAWVLTESDNDAAMRLYAALGGQPTTPVMFDFDLDSD